MIYLKKLCVFYLLMKVLLQICPHKSYETFVNALIEWIAILLLMIPLCSSKGVFANWREWEEKIQATLDGKSQQMQEEVPDFLDADQTLKNEMIENVCEDTAEEMRENLPKGYEENELGTMDRKNQAAW